jgi:hypothetical protein
MLLLLMLLLLLQVVLCWLDRRGYWSCSLYTKKHPIEHLLQSMFHAPNVQKSELQKSAKPSSTTAAACLQLQISTTATIFMARVRGACKPSIKCDIRARLK